MGYVEEIDNALAAHVLWKQRLKNAIEKGSSEFSVTGLQADYFCDFGKWLYGLPLEMRTTANWIKAQKLHAEFHLEAARVLSVALNQRKKGEALRLLGPGEKYTTLSEQMSVALTQWKQALKDPAV